MHVTRETRRARQHLKSSCEEDVGSIDTSICSGKAMGLRLILNQTRVLLSLFMPKSSVEHSAQTRFGEDAVTIKYILIVVLTCFCQKSYTSGMCALKPQSAVHF